MEAGSAMKVVVTGGNGFIGTAIVLELLRRSSEVVVLDTAAVPRHLDGHARDVTYIQGSILDKESLRTAFRGAAEVYHLAGKLGTSELDDNVEMAVTVNVIGAVNVFDAAVAARVERVFYPVKPNVWLNAYSITKYASEQFAQLYNQSGRVKICSLRYFNAFGPRQATVPIRKILPAFAVHALRGLPIEVYGNGEQTVDMVYAPDLAAMTVGFTRTAYAGEALDCGSGVGISVNEVARTVNEYLGNPAGVRHVAMRRGETPNTTLVANNRRLLDLLGGFTFSKWEETLGTTLDWYASRDSNEIDRAVAFHRF